MSDSYVKGKDKNQILAEMYGIAQPNTVVHEQQKAAILVRCTEDLENAINSLNKKITALDYILVGATFVGALATAVMAYKVLFP